MKRFAWFLLLLIATLAAFLLIATWYAAVENESMSNMMGQMMGGQNLGGISSSTISPYIWASLLIIIALVIVASFGFVYYALFPEISISRQSTSDGVIPQPMAVAESNNTKIATTAEDRLSTLLRASKPDERKVLEVLESHGGKSLQKTIVKESRLSRLKTHRIVSRFAERGIVNVIKSGNTNEVEIKDWLKQKEQSSKTSDTSD